MTGAEEGLTQAVGQIDAGPNNDQTRKEPRP